MEILSIQFISFFAIVFATYYLLPHKYQNLVLLLASLTFFLLNGIENIPILAIVILSNFLIGPRIENSTHKRSWLITGLFINILVFVFFKATQSVAISSLVDTILLRGNTQYLTTKVLIPIGVSFYILQAISYLLDIYHGRVTASKSLVQFGVYMSYFPKALAGPIERASSFLPLLRRERAPQTSNIRNGSGLILLGMTRKLIIANGLNGVIPHSLLTGSNHETGLTPVVFLLLYAFWLYNDFAGYTNIVCGVSLLLGIELSPNFRRPYFSRNFSEFWNRWHISFAHWLRDYIFMPVGRFLLRRNRNINHFTNLVIPPMLTMILSGVWHGFSKMMLIWGFLHGIYLIGNQLLKRNRTVSLLIERNFFFDKIRTMLVFLLVVVSWIFFSSDGLTPAFALLKGLLQFSKEPFTGEMRLLWYPFFLIGTCLIIDWRQEKSNNELFFLEWPLITRAGLYTVIISWIILSAILQYGLATSPSFLYQSF